MLDLRAGQIERNDLIDRLAGDQRLGLDRAALQAIIDDAHNLAGAAAAQVDAFVLESGAWAKKYPEAAAYAPGDIL